MLQKEGRGGALHRARDERTKRGAGGRRAEGGGGGREPVFERSWRKWWLIPHLLTYITLVSPPPSTPTIGRHKLSRYNAAYGTAGRPAAAAPRHRRDPLNDTRPPALPSPTPPNRARASPLLDKIMSRWRAHLGRNSSTRPGRGSLDNRASVDARVIRVWFQISGINIVGSYFFFFLYWRNRSRKTYK